LVHPWWTPFRHLKDAEGKLLNTEFRRIPAKNKLSLGIAHLVLVVGEGFSPPTNIGDGEAGNGCNRGKIIVISHPGILDLLTCDTAYLVALEHKG
jgi:hypothetical protein